jgi:hypothetical protein
LWAPPTPVLRRPVSAGGIFAGRKADRKGQNFADLTAVVYRLATGVLAIVLQALHG